MAICRVEKTKNYTVMSNFHLDDTRLSLKSVGLLSKILRLPDDWDFSIKGLAKICHDGADSIESSLKELEKYHYIKRERLRDEKGHVGKMLYTIYEIPYDTDRAVWSKPVFVSAGKKSFQPDTVFPDQVNPDSVSPDVDFPDQAQPKEERPDAVKPDRVIPSQINNISNQNPNQKNKKKNKNEINQSSFTSEGFIPEREDRLKELRRKINYQRFVEENRLLDEKLEEDTITLEEFSENYINLQVLDMILESVADAAESGTPLSIGGRTVSAEVLLDRFLRLSHGELSDIVHLIVDKQPKNRRVYALTVIYNR